MKIWKIIPIAAVTLIFTGLAIAGPQNTQNTQNTQQDWAKHTGGFVSGELGVNVLRVSLGSNGVTQGAGITGQVEFGYNFIPAVAVVGGTGCYFSGLALGVHAGVRGFLPVSQRINVLGDAGIAYLETFAAFGAAGPYVGIGTSFAMSPKADLNVMVNDVILSFGSSSGLSGDEVTGNVVSILFGVTYHFQAA